MPDVPRAAAVTANVCPVIVSVRQDSAVLTAIRVSLFSSFLFFSFCKCLCLLRLCLSDKIQPFWLNMRSIFHFHFYYHCRVKYYKGIRFVVWQLRRRCCTVSLLGFLVWIYIFFFINLILYLSRHFSLHLCLYFYIFIYIYIFRINPHTLTQVYCLGTCPVLCSNNGEYRDGGCHCFPGWKGVECSIR